MPYPGISASFSGIRPLVLEGGASTFIFASGVYTRAGVAIPFLNHRNIEGRGWSIYGSPLVGYRFLQTIPFDVSDTFHGVSLTFSVDAVWWFAPHFGLDFELTGGAIYWVSKTAGTSPSLFPDGRLAIGFAF